MRQTEIGLIPEEWEIKSVAELIDESSIISHLDGNHGALYPKSNEFVEDGVAYVGANALINNKIDYGKAKYLSAKRADTFIKGVAKAGDVLFAHNATVGPVGLVDNSYDKIILSTTLTYYRTDNSKLLSKYLLYEFQTDRFIRQYSSVMSQSTRNQVPISPQRKFVVCVPPLPEQEAIAEALSDADAWIESLEQLIAKKRLVKQGAMQELLSPKEDWEVKKLGEVGEIVTGNTPSTTDISNYGEDFLFISPADLGTSKYIFNSEKKLSVKGFSLSRKLKINSVLITCIGSTIGKLGITKFTSCTNQQINAICCNDNYNYGFLYYLLALNSEIIKLSASQQAVPLLNKTDFSNLEFPFPSLTEQTRIATILSDMDAELEALESQLGKAKKVKQGMMQELLTGRVRLV